MNRRHYLATLAAVALAGCADSDAASGETATRTASTGEESTGGTVTTDGPGTDGGGTGETTTTAERLAPGEVELPVPMSALDRGAPKDRIPAIVDPAFGPDWSSLEPPETGEQLSLQDSDRVIGVTRDGRARAYPLRILNWHEVVNDTFAGPLLVTYCPLCGSGVTAKRTVNGKETQFGVSGLLWRSDLVMYDARTKSLWSQILAKAIRGPKTGTRLSLVPSTMTTWGEWQDAHPDTEVLLPPPKSGAIDDAEPRNYNRNPYADYADSSRIGIGYNEFEDDRLHPKTQVIGVTHDGTAKAYPLPKLGESGIVNDTVAGLPVVVTSTPKGSLFAYERTVDGETLTFEAAGEKRMRGGGSRWERTTGRAIDGPHEGTTLARANDRSQMFWFAWLDFHPETALYSG